MLPLIADSAALWLQKKVDVLSACFFAFMLPLIADSAAVFLLMPPPIALSLQKARQPKG